MNITLTQHGKEIEVEESPLMDEMFKNFSIMYEHYITQDEIEQYFLATQNEAVVGFIGVGYCGRVVLIEVLEQGKGIGSSLVRFAVSQGYTRAWQPRQDGCKEFWAKMTVWASENPECEMKEVA